MVVFEEEQDWQEICAIPLDAFKKLFIQKADPTNKRNVANTCQVIATNNGSFHRCVSIEVPGEGGFVIRVPAHGTPKGWRERHAWALRSEVATMNYIRAKTNVPIPEVFAYDWTGRNPIGAPYIIMSRVKGVPAGSMWYDNARWSWSKVNLNSNPTADRKRLNFLNSLACIMADLGRLSFNQTGRLQRDDASGQTRPYPTHEEPGEDDAEDGPTFSSSWELWEHKISKNVAPYQGSSLFEDRRVSHVKQGLKMVLDIISKVQPMAYSRSFDEGVETFVLNHFDLGLQNIFVDSDGFVTGVIDWDGCRVVPRCVGYASLPEFLQLDYYCRTDTIDSHGLNQDPVRNTLKLCQERYAQYMVQATTRASDGKVGDGKYTLNTEFYQGAYMAMINGYVPWTEKYLQNVFCAIPGLEAKLRQPIEAKALVEKLGREACEHRQTTIQDLILPMLKQGILNLFRPRAP